VTITDYDPPSPFGLRRDKGKSSQSSTVIVARKWAKNGGEARETGKPLQERELDKKEYCQL
jgi:hypothetical protein